MIRLSLVRDVRHAAPALEEHNQTADRAVQHLLAAYVFGLISGIGITLIWWRLLAV